MNFIVTERKSIGEDSASGVTFDAAALPGAPVE
jgi:hypothetical protein